MVKNPPANAGDIRDAGSIPGWGRSPGGEHGNSLSILAQRIPMDRGACWAIVHGVAKSQTGLKRLSTHACIAWHEVSDTCSQPADMNNSTSPYPKLHLNNLGFRGVLTSSIHPPLPCCLLTLQTSLPLRMQ